MGYHDDWESLMNDVFGAGGRVRSGGAPAQKPEAKKAPASLPALNKTLLEQQKALDELLRAQTTKLKKQDDTTQKALAESYDWIASGGGAETVEGIGKEGGSGEYINHVEETAGKKEEANMYR